MEIFPLVGDTRGGRENAMLSSLGHLASILGVVAMRERKTKAGHQCRDCEKEIRPGGAVVVAYGAGGRVCLDCAKPGMRLADGTVYIPRESKAAEKRAA